MAAFLAVRGQPSHFQNTVIFSPQPQNNFEICVYFEKIVINLGINLTPEGNSGLLLERHQSRVPGGQSGLQPGWKPLSHFHLFGAQLLFFKNEKMSCVSVEITTIEPYGVDLFEALK